MDLFVHAECLVVEYFSITAPVSRFPPPRWNSPDVQIMSIKHPPAFKDQLKLTLHQIIYYLTLVNQHPCYWIIVLFFLVLTLLTLLSSLPNSVSAFHARHLPAYPGNNPPDSGKEKKLEVLSYHSFALSDVLYVPCSVISVSPTKQICFPHTPKNAHLDIPVHIQQINLPFPLLH